MNNLDKKLYDKALQHCANEPIHQIGTIQPHGAVLVLSSDSPRTVLQFSTNLSTILGFSSNVASGSTLVSVMGEKVANDVEQLILVAKEHQTAVGKLTLEHPKESRNLQVLLYRSEGLFVLELEHDAPSEQACNTNHLFLNMQKQLLTLSVEKEVTPYFNQIAQLIRELTDYDSVMVYRFDSNWNGEVIAQNSIEGATSYLGLNFPSSDIPPQARRLYTLNLVRLIANINDIPVPLTPPLNPISQQPLDMTYSVLRSLSPVHLEYLRNMGVNATMTISVMHNNRLWGLITCHHYSPKHVSIYMREMALFIGQMVSIQLSSIEIVERLSFIDRSEVVVSTLLQDVHKAPLADILKVLLPQLQELLSSTGIVCVVEGTFYQYGETLDPSDVKELLAWINTHSTDKFFSTNHLSMHFDQAKDYKQLAAGIIFSQLTNDMNNCIIWLRKEKLHTIDWAGKYEEGFYWQDSSGEFKISPRKSFSSWSELIQGQSEDWNQNELLTARSIVRILAETFAEKSRQEESVAKQKLVDTEMRIAAKAFEAQEGIMVTDAYNNILRVNQAFTTITGYTAEEAIGQTPKLISSGLQDKAFYERMWDAINQTGAWEGEILNRRKNGDIYPERLIITAVKDISGTVTNYVATQVDITVTKAASMEIENLAFYDPLTQLPNRRLLMDRIGQALAASARSGQRGALLFLDLDHFKILNDTLGHDIGDLLLKQVAERLVNCVREGDTVARLGGDEFVVLLEDLSEDALEAAKQTEIIAEKIIARLNQPYVLGAHHHNSSPSVGATLFYNHDVEMDILLKQADIAMYQAKDSGRNTLRFFDPKMQEVISLRVDLEHELRKAIEQQQFELYYQIQVDNTNNAIGAEALIRWQHPERGMISPYNFITLAEETGLIIPIGRWVLESACAQLKSWKQNPLTRDLMLSINVSAKQFFQTDFVELVQAALSLHEVDPKRLKIELTESMLVENIHDIIIKMNKLSKIGIRFSLDDFGTGYSSLQYLKKLPLNQLKIDQSFVKDIVTDASDRAIVRTIITMARGLSLDIIAEGVESDNQLAYLVNYGCNNYQGYLFSKPVQIDEFEALLSKS